MYYFVVDGMSGYNLTSTFLNFFDSTVFATLAELSDKLRQFENVSLHFGNSCSPRVHST